MGFKLKGWINRSIIVDHLRREFNANNKVGVACVYCNSKGQARQTVDSILASLLLQLVVARGGPVDDEMLMKFTRYFYHEIRRYSKVFLIVDALDELGKKLVKSIATTCLESFLTLGHSPNSEDSLREQLAGAPPVVYAAEQWGSHARQELDWKSEKDASPIKAQAQELLETSDKLQCAIRVMSLSQYSLQRRKDVTKLHILAYFGIDQLLERFLRGKLDINAKDNHGTTALHWAVRNGHKAMVKLLVNNKNTNINAKDSYGRTALHWAARSANKDIMSLLL
ncbi:ankyrin repeat-containing protein [Aspergillus flavus]|nr:ankyrin repeat-containing protein [Aspergillus flavus]RAQ80390.1 ankyrin repeat-containing protein [Aspergillus flavus]